jgi:dTMP kinase
MKGSFIVMEGPDGSGKTTQISLLIQYLEDLGIDYIVTREPGGTRIGEAIRQIILNPEFKEMSDVTEMLLYAASRAQLMKDVISPAIQAGKVVIS